MRYTMIVNISKSSASSSENKIILLLLDNYTYSKKPIFDIEAYITQTDSEKAFDSIE